MDLSSSLFKFRLFAIRSFFFQAAGTRNLQKYNRWSV